MAKEFLSLIVEQARDRKLLSDEHFTVDGTLVEARAGQKSFQRKPNKDGDPLNPPPVDKSGDPTVNWHKEKRSNHTHQSLIDPAARQNGTRHWRCSAANQSHVALRERKRVEEVFGWMKTVALQRKTRFRGLRMRNLTVPPA